MSTPRDFDQQLRALLVDTAPAREPDALFDAVLSATSTVRQRPRLLVGRGTAGMPPNATARSRTTVALAAGLLVVAIAGIAIFAGGAARRPDSVQTTPSPTASPSPSPSPESSASANAFPSRSPSPVLPGQSWILYERFVQLGGGLFVMRPDGTDSQSVLTTVGGVNHQADWSPDGNRVVFMDATADALWIAGIDGSNAQRIAACDTGGCGNPAWSPDGGRIAFSRVEAKSGVVGPAAGGIYILDLASGKVTIVVRLERPLLADVPRWSPDGTQLVIGVDRMDDLTSETDTGAAIAIVPATGGAPRYLTPFSGFGYSPDWSQTGNKIVFAPQVRDTGTWDLFSVNADGTGLRQLTHVPAGDRLWGADWTQDGTRIIAGDQGRRVAVDVDPATGSIQVIGGASLAFGRDRPIP